MRRRTLIQAAVAAALTGILPRHSRAEKPVSTLFAFAVTIAPGLDAGEWLSETEKSRLTERYEALDSAEKLRCGEFLSSLDKTADGSFAALGQDRRVSLLASRAGGTSRAGFGRLRALVLDVYFTGEAGLKLSGYRKATQFEGYPEYFTISQEWE
jgi:hypothetical protein